MHTCFCVESQIVFSPYPENSKDKKAQLWVYSPSLNDSVDCKCLHIALLTLLCRFAGFSIIFSGPTRNKKIVVIW